MIFLCWEGFGFFDASIRMEVFSMLAQAIHCHAFSLSHKQYFLLSVVYGANTSSDRRILWRELSMVKYNMGDVPWLACGDFNTELFMSERSEYYDGMLISSSFLEFR